jgi:hypothetical protein
VRKETNYPQDEIMLIGFREKTLVQHRRVELDAVLADAWNVVKNRVRWLVPFFMEISWLDPSIFVIQLTSNEPPATVTSVESETIRIYNQGLE